MPFNQRWQVTVSMTVHVRACVRACMRGHGWRHGCGSVVPLEHISCPLKCTSVSSSTIGHVTCVWVSAMSQAVTTLRLTDRKTAYLCVWLATHIILLYRRNKSRKSSCQSVFCRTKLSALSRRAIKTAFQSHHRVWQHLGSLVPPKTVQS